MLSALNATLTLQGYCEAGTKSPPQAFDEILRIMYLNVLPHYLHPEENKVIAFPFYVSAEPAGLVCAPAGGNVAMPASPRAAITR